MLQRPRRTAAPVGWCQSARPSAMPTVARRVDHRSDQAASLTPCDVHRVVVAGVTLVNAHTWGLNSVRSCCAAILAFPEARGLMRRWRSSLMLCSSPIICGTGSSLALPPRPLPMSVDCPSRLVRASAISVSLPLPPRSRLVLAQLLTSPPSPPRLSSRHLVHRSPGHKPHASARRPAGSVSDIVPREPPRFLCRC